MFSMSTGDENISSQLGERLRDARVRLGLSQDAVAASCGVSREMWGKYERGHSVPGGEVLAAVAALGADVRYILTGLPAGYTAPPLATTLTQREESLLDNYRHASEAGRKALDQTGAALAQSKVVKKSA